MISRFFSFLFSRGLWVFLGLLVISFLIWTVGPSLSVNNWYLLDSQKVRLWVIGTIWGIWLLRIIWRKWREGRLNAQLLGQLRKPRPEAELKAMPEAERAEIKVLSERFDEAITLLRNSRFEAGENKSPLARFSKQYLYQLPWYVFIGAPGSGKTTALVNSGLNFPLADRFGKVALKGIGGTRNCDWWFTDEAVLLDTAGRYTTHESDPTGDEQEWKGFLNLLTKYRGRQPINGVMLTVSVADLLSATDTERVAHAAVLRRRLQELREELGIQFPVYVLVTKTDLLSGFEEYFATFSRQELDQIWGFTIPYEQAQKPDFKLMTAYDAEYELLQKRLYEALPDVLAAEPDDTRRALAYLLPQQFAGLRQVLGHFLSDVFSSSKFESVVIPRGIYFTSGTQGGQTFDRVTGQLKKYLKIEGIRDQGSGIPLETGKSYFLHNLLKDVVFPESMLAGLNLKWERRYRTIQWGGYVLLTAILAICLLVWLNSYRNNRNYLEHVGDKLPGYNQLSRDIKITESGDVLGLVPFMNATTELPNGKDFSVESLPVWNTFGLYQGSKIAAAANSIYDETIKQVLLPQVSRRIENALENAPPDDLEYSYEALRAYLMMYDAEHYDPSFLQSWVLSDMQKILPAGYTTQDYDQLKLHINRLFNNGVMSSPFPKNDALIERVRGNLDRHALAERVYSRMLRLLSGQSLTQSTFITLGGAEASTVFFRKSGKPLNEGIPGLYTYNGYWNVFSKSVENVATQLREDDTWVLEVKAGSFADGSNRKLFEDVKKRYFDDYVQYWDNYLADVSVRKSQTMLQSIEIARSLSSSNSPLVKFVKGVALETTLLREDEENQRSLLDRARERVTGSTQSLESMFGSTGIDNPIRRDATEEKLEKIVDNHFVQYRELARSAGQGVPPPIEGTTGLLNELYTYLTAADTALRSQSPLPPADVLTKLQAEAGRVPPAVGGVLTDLSVTASRQVAGVRQEKVGEDVNAVLGNFCRRSIAGRYPFGNSSKDVAPNDFARFFGPQQMMDQFFRENLASLVDMSGGKWRFKPGIDGNKGGVAGFLDSFEKAAVIRDVYFAAGKLEPSYKVAVRPIDMDPEITQMVVEVDGQTLTYAHGPQVGTTMEWPGKQGSNQVSISLQPQIGTSGISASGPWALNRLLDRASLRQGRSPEVTVATFNIGGRRVTLEFAAYSAKSPFRLSDMRSFRCPGKG